MHKITISSIDKLYLAVDLFFGIVDDDTRVVFLHGDLGTGKTTFVKEVARRLGCKDDVSSPTYSLINEYDIGDNAMYHIDLYRLNTIEEALDIGIEQYLDSGNLCFVEWPDIIAPLVEKHLEISIQTGDDDERTFVMNLL